MRGFRTMLPALLLGGAVFAGYIAWLLSLTGSDIVYLQGGRRVVWAGWETGTITIGWAPRNPRRRTGREDGFTWEQTYANSWPAWSTIYRVNVSISRGFVAPSWVPAAVFAVLSWLLVRPLLSENRRRLGLCTGCGYDLTGNESGVCSECGMTVGEK